jgi:hypothetical protein
MFMYLVKLVQLLNFNAHLPYCWASHHLRVGILLCLMFEKKKKVIHAVQGREARCSVVEKCIARNPEQTVGDRPNIEI